MQKVIDRLERLHIDKARIQTSSFSVSPNLNCRRNAMGMRRRCTGDYRLYGEQSGDGGGLRTLDKIAAVIEQTLAAGANHFQGVQWALKDEQRAKLGAMKQAVSTAQEKAATLSESLKLKLLRLISVSEGGHVARPCRIAHVR